MDQSTRYISLLLCSAAHLTPSITWQHLGYAYAASGNLASLAGQTLSYSDTAHPHAATGLGSQSYSYDAASGNLASLAGQTLSYTDTAHPHAATGLGSQSYAYDANGNMISRQIASGTYTLSYDAEGRLTGNGRGWHKRRASTVARAETVTRKPAFSVTSRCHLRCFFAL